MTHRTLPTRRWLASRRTAFAHVATAALLALAGCATPLGKPFTEPAAVAAGQAQVYLYRASALYASGQSFSAWVNQAPPQPPNGELANASYLHWVLPPGTHTVRVKPGVLGDVYEQHVILKSGETAYLEIQLPSFILGNAFHAGSNLQPRTAAEARAAMQGLVGMQ